MAAVADAASAANVTALFAAKSFPHPAVRAIAARVLGGFDVASPGELADALRGRPRTVSIADPSGAAVAHATSGTAPRVIVSCDSLAQLANAPARRRSRSACRHRPAAATPRLARRKTAVAIAARGSASMSNRCGGARRSPSSRPRPAAVRSASTCTSGRSPRAAPRASSMPRPARSRTPPMPASRRRSSTSAARGTACPISRGRATRGARRRARRDRADRRARPRVLRRRRLRVRPRRRGPRARRSSAPRARSVARLSPALVAPRAGHGRAGAGNRARDLCGSARPATKRTSSANGSRIRRRFRRARASCCATSRATRSAGIPGSAASARRA